MDKEVRKMVEKAEAAGWIVRRGRHIVCYAPDGETVVTLPLTPSDHRWVQNARSKFRRGGLDLRKP